MASDLLVAPANQTPGFISLASVDVNMEYYNGEGPRNGDVKRSSKNVLVLFLYLAISFTSNIVI